MSPKDWPMAAARTLTLALLLLCALRSIGLALGWVLPTAWCAPLALGMALTTIDRRPRNSAGASSPDAARWLCVWPLLCAAVLIGWTYSGPNILPVHDPIAIPALAAHLAAGELPAQIYPRGTFGHAYPPGAPLLFSTLWAAATPAQGLMLLKYITLLALALIPALWGWLIHRLFVLPLSAPVWLSICYLAFWGLERTIGFVLPFAGKTALIWALALCPPLLAFLVSCARSGGWWRWTVGGLALFGLIMINYSMAHLVAACVGGIWLATFERTRAHWTQGLRLGAMLGLAALLLLVLMRDAISDPRAGSFHLAPWTHAKQMVAVFLARSTPVVIFHNTDFGLVQPVYRGAIQLGAWCLAWMAAPRIAQGQYTRSLRACLGAILFILLAGFGVVPAGITLDYARWIVWPVQALSFAVVMAIALTAAREWRGWPRAAAGLAICALAGMAAVLILLDAPALKRTVRNDAVPIRQLVHEARWLEAMAGETPCRLIGESHLTGDNISVYFTGRLYSYVALVSRCRFINGSWVDKGAPEARAWDGLPTASHLRQALSGGSRPMLIGPPERMAPYMARLAGDGLDLQWEALRLSGASSVWRAHSSPAPDGGSHLNPAGP